MSNPSAPPPEPIKINFRPGVNRETTDYGNTGGWYDCNLARVKTGTWNSMGGWQPFTTIPVQGTFRSLFPWSTLNGNQYYGTGTNLKYYIIRGNTPNDVTPIRLIVNPMAANPFETGAMGSTTITVTDVGNGAMLNDFVTYSGATGPIGGVPASQFNTEHQITSIIDADHYTIQVTTPATTGAATGGGSVVIATYQISVGLNTQAFGDGWGTGAWGIGGWGLGSGAFVSTSQIRLWSEDNFGEDLLLNPRDGGIYYQDMGGSLSVPAVNITSLPGADPNTPIIARQVLVSTNDRHVIVFATNPVGSAIQDRLLLRWADTESLTDWTASDINTAGSLDISSGSEFLRAVETTTEILVFTDISLTSVRYVGAPFVFGQTQIATNVQLIGPNAVVSTGALTAWMANGRFQWYNGVVTDMPCDVRTYIFSILNTEQTSKILAGTNRQFSEFIWLMPVNGSSENNFYVICNFEASSKVDVRYGGALTWYYGFFNNLGRTTWLDATFSDFPLAGATDGIIYYHEIGATDNSVNPPLELNSYIQSSVFELAAGGNFMLVSRTIPDIDFTGSTATNPAVNMTFEKRDYPGSPFVDGPVDNVTRTVLMPVEQYTTKIDKRFRARSVQFGVESAGVGTQWSLGTPRLYANPDGQR